MGWNEKYWDIIDRYYWTPDYLGLESIPRKHWLKREGWVCVPQKHVNNNGPLYSRKSNLVDNRIRLQRGEEPLNDIFNLTFAISANAVVSRLLFEKVGITDGGPFTSLGRELGKRYGWGDANVTQHDGFFSSAHSLLGVELKLKTRSWPEQLLKYLALMVMEERCSFNRSNLGLLFITPKQKTVWEVCGLKGPITNDGLLLAASSSKLNRQLLSLFENNRDHVQSVVDRLQSHLRVVTWADLSHDILQLIQGLDQTDMGQQTLYRLLDGFREQIRLNPDTGVSSSEPH